MAAVGGLAVGFASILLSCLAILVHIVFGLAGLVAGLASVVPCWWRGDAAGRSLALLGPAPALAVVVSVAASDSLREMPPGQVAPLIPFLTVDQALLAVAVAIPAACAAIFGPAILQGPDGPKAKPGDRDPLA